MKQEVADQVTALIDTLPVEPGDLLAYGAALNKEFSLALASRVQDALNKEVRRKVAEAGLIGVSKKK